LTPAFIPPGQIFVIGDSHIGLSDGSEKPINAWLDRLAALRPRALYLNGDLFHYLIAHAKFKTSSVEQVMAKFREIRDAGIPIHYVEGNRDFFLKGSFVEDAVTDIGLEYAVPAGTNRYLIVHGDMINDRDWPYRFWRTASKNPVSRLGVDLIPKKMARNFVDSVERRLAGTNFKHKSNLPWR
jgi:UDP-2,3-diacylglucosamine hydrolase